jgi:prepilin-type N-terminal cleavage/methylation domain-containing protein
MTARRIMRRRRSTRRHGFTLMELVTVIVILGIVGVAVGTPTLAFVSTIRARAASSRLTTDIRFMQRMALSSGLRTWIVLSTASNNYRLYIEDSANLGKAGRLAVTHPYDQSSSPIQFGSGPFSNVSISSVNINSTSEIEFDSLGVPYDGNSAKLTASGSIGLSNGVSIMIYPDSGFVERAG